MQFQLNFFKFFSKIFLTTIFFSTFVSIVYTQQSEDTKTIVTNSWQKGSGVIDEKSLRIKLTNDEFNLDIFDLNKKRKFRLQIEKFFFPTVRKPNPQCFSFALKELFADKVITGESLGSNLFLTGNTIETSAHIICPIEKPIKVFDGGLYSVNAERIFYIEKFSVNIKIIDYTYDVEENRLNEAEIEIDFNNRTLLAKTEINK